MPIPPLRGRFLWHELMTSDPKSAVDFFTKVVGWKAKAWDQDPFYTLLTTKGMLMAGVMPLPEEAKREGTAPMWFAYIGTPNVDETARQAQALGGKILKQPSDIPTIGRFAILQDPQGAIFNAFTPKMASPAPDDAPPGIGDFSWHELITTDWRAALQFYKNLFGWEETESMDMGPEMGTYQMYGWKGRTLGGMMNKPKQDPRPPAWLSYIRVPDSKKAAATVKKAGGQIVHGPMEVPGGGWIAQGVDRQGVLFAVHSTKPERGAKPARAKKAKPARRKAARKPAAKRRSTKKTTKKKAGSKKRRR